MRKLLVVIQLWKFTVLMMLRDLTKGCFHFPPWSRTCEGIESSNSQWYRLWLNTITQRLLLLRQQAEIKAVPIGASLGRFRGSHLWCFPYHLHHHQRHHNSLKHSATALMKSHVCTWEIIDILISLCIYIRINTETITLRSNDDESSNCRGRLYCTAGVLWNWGSWQSNAGDILKLKGKPLGREYLRMC